MNNDKKIQRYSNTFFRCVLVLTTLLSTAACGRNPSVTSNQTQPVILADFTHKSVDAIVDDDLYTVMEWIREKPVLTEHDFAQARHVLTELARRGSSVAEHGLGVWYADERNPEHNIEQALHWHTQAALHGSKGAQNDLGYLLLGENGEHKDLEKAEYWFLKSAESSNNPMPMKNLAVLYIHNTTPKDYKKAIYWFDKAAQLKDVSATLSYVQIQGYGLVSPIDYEKAYYRGILLYRMKKEMPDAWAKFASTHANAAGILDGAMTLLSRALQENKAIPIEEKAYSADLSKELRLDCFGTGCDWPA